MGNIQGPESDLWALGVLLYELHMGKEPFEGKSSSDMLHLISNQPIKFSSKYFTREAMNLVKSLLKFKPNKRIKLREILKLKFIRKFRSSIKNEEMSTAYPSPIIQFNPPQKAFISQFKNSHKNTIRKSRPKFNNMAKFKSLVNFPGSLYQPNQFEKHGLKSSRIISTKKRKNEQAVKPKIYLKQNYKNSKRKIENKGFNNSQRTMENKSKTFSNLSGGFLSKDDDKEISKEHKINQFFKKDSKISQNKKKQTLTTKNENLKENITNTENCKSLLSQQNSGQSLLQNKNSFKYRLSKQNSIKLSVNYSASPDKNKSQKLKSSEKHFIKSINSKINNLRLETPKSQIKNEQVNFLKYFFIINIEITFKILIERKNYLMNMMKTEILQNL